MKKSKKIVALSLALALVLSSMGNVFAYQLGDDVYSGIQVDDTFYSARYITDNKTAFGNVFGHANSGNVILDFNGNAAKFSDYLAANPADFDTWAAAHKTPANPGKLVKPDGSIVTIGGEVELTVKSAVAVNGTTIDVVFSDNSTARITGLTLVAGTHDVPFTYCEKSYVAKDVTYNLPAPTTASLEKVEFVNYRNIIVTFNKVVDEDSATDASNYYFEIVDGNAHYGAVPTLQDSNQLSQITTLYPGGAGAWWNGVYDNGKEIAPPHIYARELNGKTVVSICLPEDARFTNIKDNESGDYPDPYFDGDEYTEDDERTLAIKQRTSKTGDFIKKLLIKNTVVNVAVRNVKDTDGKLSIDTAVMPITILDEVRPQLLGVDIVDNPILDKGYAALGRNLGDFDLARSDKQLGERMQFIYSEPVFDAHGFDKSDLEYYRDVKLYVEGKKIASLFDGTLDKYMKFDMYTGSTYEASRIVTLDVEAAVKDACHELFATGMYYDVRFSGVTDLAGNIEESSEHSFRVKFHDDPAQHQDPTPPEVIDVVQVADNMFRVEFNRVNAEGNFVIFNPDGEGVGDLNVRIPRSALSKDGVHYYSYVAVPARDHEPCDAIPTGHNQNQVLAYDGMDKINRNIRVEDVIVYAQFDDISQKDMDGDDFIPTAPMTMVDDILAPVAIEPDEIEYEGRGATINIPVEDVIPWVAPNGSKLDVDIDYEYEVFPIAYRYDEDTQRFYNEIRREQEGKDTYLPIKVSYVDNKGAKHEAMISNYDLRPWEDLDGIENTDINPGYDEAITYNFSDDILTLDLSEYPQLLDANKELVAGKTYKVEIPKGYFSDSPKDTHFEHLHKVPVPTPEVAAPDCNCDTDFRFGGEKYDILAVDDGRDADNYRGKRCQTDSGLGYTSAEQLLEVDVEAAPIDEPDPEYVPQTSKQLINYDEPTNTMRIEFTGTIDVNTLTNKNNYSFDGRTIAEWDALLGTNTVIEYLVEADKQFAIFEIPQDSIQEDDDYSFRVEGVSHPNGGTMTPVDTVVGLRDTYRPVVESAVVTGDSQIKLTFNEAIKYFVDVETIDAHSTAKNFIVMVGGVEWSVDTAVLPTGRDNNREIILHGTEMPETGNITVEIVKDQNGNILVIDYATHKNPMKLATYNVTR